MSCASKQVRMKAGIGTVSSWISKMLFSTGSMWKNGAVFARHCWAPGLQLWLKSETCTSCVSLLLSFFSKFHYFQRMFRLLLEMREIIVKTCPGRPAFFSLSMHICTSIMFISVNLSVHCLIFALTSLLIFFFSFTVLQLSKGILGTGSQ